MTIHNVPISKLPFKKSGHVEKVKRNKIRLLNRYKRFHEKRERIIRADILENLRKKSRINAFNPKENKKKVTDAINTILPKGKLIKSKRALMRELVKGIIHQKFTDQDTHLKEFARK